MSSSPQIEEIKSKLDIVDVVSRYIPLKKSGINYKAPCPFHHEKTPSFMVNRERQSYKCFGCGEAGDVISFVMKQENIDFGQALEILADQVGVTLEKQNAPSGPSKKSLIAVNDLAAKFWHYILTEHASGQAARDYLKKRGVTEASIRTFMIGYAPVDGSALKKLFAKHQLNPDVVYRAGSPERFRHRIMFPFRDVVGSVIGFSGRALGDEQPKYLNTSDTTLFHKNRFLYGLFESKKNITEKKPIIMVEGQLDVVLSHQAGFPTTVATSGTALTEEHIKLLQRYSPKTILAFDGDTAGQKALDRAIRLAATAEYPVSVAHLPDGQDPGDIASQNPAEWGRLITSAIDPIDWLLTYHFPEGANQLNKRQRDEVYAALFPYLKSMPDAVSQSAALQRLARLLGITDDESLKQIFESWKSPAQSPTPQIEPTPVPLSPPPKLNANSPEWHVIALLLHHPELLVYQEFHLPVQDFTNQTVANLYKTIQNEYTRGTIQSTDLINSVQKTLLPADASAFQSLVFDSSADVTHVSPDQLLADYSMTITRLKNARKESRMQTYASLIAQAEASNNRAEVVRLMQEMQSEYKDNSKLKH